MSTEYDYPALLRAQADEIERAGHNGWPNTMRFAADHINSLRAELDASLQNADSWAATVDKLSERLRAENEANKKLIADAAGKLLSLRDERDQLAEQLRASEARGAGYFWDAKNSDCDSFDSFDSIDELVNLAWRNDAEIGSEITVQRAARLPDVRVRLIWVGGSPDDADGEAGYELLTPKPTEVVSSEIGTITADRSDDRAAP